MTNGTTINFTGLTTGWIFYRNHGTIMDPKNNALKDEFTRSYDDLMVFS